MQPARAAIPVTRPPALTREGPSEDEVRIIGVELACRDQQGREHELEMFACSHTMPADPYGHGIHEIRVTLHSSRGDFTLTGRAPW